MGNTGALTTLSMEVKLQAVGVGEVSGFGDVEWIPSRQNPHPTLWPGKPGALALQQEADRTGLPVFLQMAEAEAAQLKEEGNQHFQRQDYKAATKSYSQALKLTKDKALLATLYRNRAACGLKTVREQDSLGGLRAVKGRDKGVVV